MLKYLFILFLINQFAFADDLSYKDRSNEGENKYERIGKLESYLTKLSSNLSKIHETMKKDFKKDLKTLEEKISKERAADLDAQFKKIEKRFASLESGPELAKQKYAEESRGQLKTLKNRIVDLLEKVEILELKIKDLNPKP